MGMLEQAKRDNPRYAAAYRREPSSLPDRWLVVIRRCSKEQRRMTQCIPGSFKSRAVDQHVRIRFDPIKQIVRNRPSMPVDLTICPTRHRINVLLKCVSMHHSTKQAIRTNGREGFRVPVAKVSQHTVPEYLLLRRSCKDPRAPRRDECSSGLIKALVIAELVHFPIDARHDLAVNVIQLEPALRVVNICVSQEVVQLNGPCD